MKVYVASNIRNKERVNEVFNALKQKGHEVTTDWTQTEDIPEDERNFKKDYIQSIAKRDFEGIRECDAFILLSQPSEGRSMYVELGLAIAMHEARGKPLVFVVGPDSNESVFYFHHAVRRAASIEDIDGLSVTPIENDEWVSQQHKGRLEEFRALRGEMLEIINSRIWGQATYAVLVAGIFASTSTAYKVTGLIFIIVLALPFLFHTIQREEARIRMAIYLKDVLEPSIPGMNWEKYLSLWRGKFGKQEGKGWLNIGDRVKHIISYAGLYLLTAFFCFILIFETTSDFVPLLIGILSLSVLILKYFDFYKLYDKVRKDGEELSHLYPRR